MTRFKTNKFRLLADDLNSTTADITNTVSMGEKSNIYTNQSQCLVWQPKLASCSPSSALSTVSDTRVWFFCILGLDWNNDWEPFLALHGQPEIPRTSGLSGSYILENGSTCRYTMKYENFSKLWGGGGGVIVCKE